MIALGSNIGTGLFIGSGAALSRGGPLSLMLAFLLIGITLFIMMQSLTEMAVLFPVSGSFTRYATRFVDPGLGFAMGWQYWMCGVSVFAAEATAANILIGYWTQDVPVAVWISLFIVINLIIHCFPVRIFGEVEFVVSTLKVVSVLGVIVVTWVIMAGGGSDGRRHGGEYWVDPGALENGFQGLASVFVTAAFACGGTEMLGIVAGETKHPRYNFPRAVRTLMWRILIFYITSLLFITFVVPSTHPSLLSPTRNAAASPFVIAIQEAGISVLPDLLNAIVLICVCSVGSVSIYISSRVLVALAEDGMAPRIFTRTDRSGRPRHALIFSGIISSGISYLNVSSSGATVFGWFTSLSGMAFFLAWMAIIFCNFRFRKAMAAQGKEGWFKEPFAYTATFHPWLPAMAFTAVAFMAGCQFYVSLYPVGGVGRPDAKDFFGGFIGVPIFLVMWVAWKVVNGQWGFVPLGEVDLVTGRRECDAAEKGLLEKYQELSRWRKALAYVHF
ncbi:AAT family amino acid transporter [Terfezia claveryi]|nr:AAT family amino acid transporter [Terfezia claveryi]